MARRRKQPDLGHLLQCTAMALHLSDPKKWRTDYIGIACQFGKAYGVKRKDFDRFRNMTIDQIANEFISMEKSKLNFKGTIPQNLK